MAIELRPYGDDDLALTEALESDVEVMRGLGGVAGTGESARIHARRMAGIARGDWYFTIHVDGGARPAGIIAIWQTPWDGGFVHEVGTMLFPEFHAQGIAMRAFRILAERGRAEAKFSAVHAFTGVHNEPSNAIVRRLGFTPLEECDVDYEGRPLRCNHWVFQVDS